MDAGSILPADIALGWLADSRWSERRTKVCVCQRGARQPGHYGSAVCVCREIFGIERFT